MNTKTRKLQVFMRALSASDMQGNLVRNVETEMARIDAERAVGSQSGLQRAVSLPEMAED
ncbi:MAG: hypothetical protein OET44_18695 [Gammaproteobacteria bacterium]|nr:hypothetical protein [Gammaproteobacteria bacterium]